MTTILPTVAVLEMTYRCNHACRFCSCPWFAGMLKPGSEAVLSRAKRHGHFGTELPDCMIDASKYKCLNVTTGCSAATDFFTVGPNGWLRVCNHSPVELVKWDEWERLPECEEWMHYVRLVSMAGHLTSDNQICYHIAIG